MSGFSAQPTGERESVGLRVAAAYATEPDGSPTSGKRAGQPKRSGSGARQGAGGRGAARRAGSRRRSSSLAEREVNREKVLALVRERPGITKAELKAAAGLSSAATRWRAHGVGADSVVCLTDVR